MKSTHLFALFTLSVTSFLTQAANNTVSCGMDSRQQTLAGLTELSQDSRLLLGFRCDSYPHVSSFLGDWFPSYPQFSFSQQQRHKIDTNDISQDWSLAFGIKRIAEGQLSLLAGQNLSEFTLKTKEEIPLINNNSGEIAILNEQQKVRLSHKQRFIGLGMQFAYIENQPLTEVILQRSLIEQPLQANIEGFPKRSLYQAEVELSEIYMGKYSRHRGLNINWQIGLGLGRIHLQPHALTTAAAEFDKEQEKIVTLTTQLEMYYQYRINRRWFSYIRGISDVQYWYQTARDKNYEVANYQTLDYQADIGLGLTF